MFSARVIAVLSVAALTGAIYLGTYRGYLSAAPLPPQLLEPMELMDGDLVFRTGRDVMARLVLSQGKSPRFSHVGVIVKQNNQALVIHAFPHDDTTRGGVQMEPLSLFVSTKNASDVGFYRVRHIEVGSRQKIHNYALQQVGKPFDDEFQFSDDSHFYCTELVLKALAAAGIDLSQTTQHINVLTLAEPVFPPDHLRRSSGLEVMTHSPSLQGALHLSVARP